MSNWRINFGIGPFRYNAPLNSNRNKEPDDNDNWTAVGWLIVTLVMLSPCFYALIFGG